MTHALLRDMMVLLTLFQALQRRTMIAERIALKKLEAESANRLRLEAEVARVSEAERRSLGSELHDGLCQNLTAALLNCTALENRQTAAGHPDAAEVARIRKALEEAGILARDAFGPGAVVAQQLVDPVHRCSRVKGRCRHCAAR